MERTLGAGQLYPAGQHGAPAKGRRHTLPKSRHLRLPREFKAVYDVRVRESRGPLTVYAMPNGLGYPRLGMSVPRKVGTAVRRNRIRRLIRESFRLMQHDLPEGYDLVVTVRPHEPLILAEYQKMLMAMAAMAVRLHNSWRKRKPPPTSAAPPAAADGGADQPVQ